MTVILLDASGKTLGKRVLREPPPACEELVASAAFAASVAIDPTVLTRPPEPEPEPKPEPAPAPEPIAATPPVVPAAAEPPSPSFVPTFRAGGGASFGVLPATAAAVTLGASLRRGRFSAGIEGRFDLPTESERAASDAARTRVTLKTSLVVGEAHACGHLRPRGFSPFFCAFVQAGALRGSSSAIAIARDDVSPYLAAGPRLGAALPITDDLALDARADVPFALTTTELRVDDRPVWTSAVVGVVLGAGITFSLP